MPTYVKTIDDAFSLLTFRSVNIRELLSRDISIDFDPNRLGILTKKSRRGLVASSWRVYLPAPAQLKQIH